MKKKNFIRLHFQFSFYSPSLVGPNVCLPKSINQPFMYILIMCVQWENKLNLVFFSNKWTKNNNFSNWKKAHGNENLMSWRKLCVRNVVQSAVPSVRWTGALSDQRPAFVILKLSDFCWILFHILGFDGNWKKEKNQNNENYF